MCLDSGIPVPLLVTGTLAETIEQKASLVTITINQSDPVREQFSATQAPVTGLDDHS